MKNYALMTAAFNEGDFIEHTITSVISQSIPPVKWLIVNDGSTDNTRAIIEKFMDEHHFIERLDLPSKTQGDFSSKARALNIAYDRLTPLEFEMIGVLDADVSFQEDYFEKMIMNFNDDSKLGIIGGLIYEKKKHGNYVSQTIDDHSVAGAVQLFKRRCFEEIGGFLPIPAGGVDTVAEIIAKSKLWHVKTFMEIPVFHHRPVSTGHRSKITLYFQRGKTDYRMGYHPAFELFRSLYRMTDKPYILQGLLIFSGYIYSFLTRQPRLIPEQSVTYLRKSQLERLASIFKPLTR